MLGGRWDSNGEEGTFRDNQNTDIGGGLCLGSLPITRGGNIFYSLSKFFTQKRYLFLLEKGGR